MSEYIFHGRFEKYLTLFGGYLTIILLFIFLLTNFRSLIASFYLNIAAQMLINTVINHDQEYYDRLILNIESDLPFVAKNHYQDAGYFATVSNNYQLTPEAEAIRSISLLAQGINPQALNVFTGETRDVNNVLYYFWEGIAYEKAGNLSKAITIWRQIGQVDHILNRMQHYKYLGQNDRVEEYARVLIDICSEGHCRKKYLAAGWGELGNVLRITNRLEEAVDAFRYAIHVDNLPQYREGLFLSLWGLRIYKEALNILNELIADQPDNSSYFIWAGKIYEELGLLSLSEEQFRKGVIISEGKNGGWAYHEYALFLSRLGRKEEADLLMKEVISLSPENICNHLSVWVSIQKPDYQSSQAYLDAKYNYQQKCINETTK